MTAVQDWSRERYCGPAGNPLLFFVVYGKFDSSHSLSASKYRSSGPPEGCTLSHYSRESHASVLAGFQGEYPWKDLQKENANLAKKIAAAPECMILRGEMADSPTLNYLRDAVGLVTFLLDHGGVGIFDLPMLHWWAPQKWRKRIFAPKQPILSHHVAILASAEPSTGLTWYHTRGMRKFGRPDLSVHEVPKSRSDAIVELISRFIEFQALGGVIEEGQKINMRDLPSGMTCHHHGNLEDSDFNNVHVEIAWAERSFDMGLAPPER